MGISSLFAPNASIATEVFAPYSFTRFGRKFFVHFCVVRTGIFSNHSRLSFIVLTILGLEGSNTQDKVERVTAASGHLFEDAPLAFYLLLYGASNPLPGMSFLIKLLNNTPVATLQSVRLGPQGRPQNGTSLRVEVNCSRIRMLGRANTARFDFDIQPRMRDLWP